MFLTTVNVDGVRVVWATDPFLDAYFKDIAGACQLVLDIWRASILQKLAKNQASHELAVSEFEKALLIKHNAKKGNGQAMQAPSASATAN